MAVDQGMEYIAAVILDIGYVVFAPVMLEELGPVVGIGIVKDRGVHGIQEFRGIAGVFAVVAELEEVGRYTDAPGEDLRFTFLFYIPRRQEFKVSAFEHGHQGVIVDKGGHLGMAFLISGEFEVLLLEDDRAVDQAAVQTVSLVEGDDRDALLFGQIPGRFKRSAVVFEPSAVLVFSVHVAGIGHVDLFYGEIVVSEDGRQ